MFRINYLPPERMSSHQRDFPQRERPAEPIALRGGSGELWLIVAGYLLALFVGIIFVAALTPTSTPTRVVAPSTASAK